MIDFKKLWTRKPSRAESAALISLMMDENQDRAERARAVRVLAVNDLIPPYLEDVALDLIPSKGDQAAPPEGFAKTEKGKVERQRKAIMECLDDVEPEEYEWLWPRRLPRRTVSLIAGDGGAGKSTLTGALAATVTSGGCWPDIPEERVDPGRVILLTAEEGLSTDVRPRMTRFGADCRKIHVLKAIDAGEGVEQRFAIARDIPVLADVCKDLGEVGLVMIDPIGSYMSGVDTHNDAEVQHALTPLFQFADEFRLCALMVAHLNKSASASIEARIQGANAFKNKSRMVWYYSVDPRNRSRRLMSFIKGNPVDKITTGLSVGFTGGVLAWDPEPVAMDAEEVAYRLAQQLARGETGTKGGRPPDQVQKAVDFITERLSFEPTERPELERDARREEKISRTTFLRALRRMNGSVSSFAENGKQMLRLEPKLELKDRETEAG